VSMPGTASVHEAARAMRDADIGDVIVGLIPTSGFLPAASNMFRGAYSGRGVNNPKEAQSF
jgi:hypothetical protein